MLKWELNLWETESGIWNKRYTPYPPCNLVSKCTPDEWSCNGGNSVGRSYEASENWSFPWRGCESDDGVCSRPKPSRSDACDCSSRNQSGSIGCNSLFKLALRSCKKKIMGCEPHSKLPISKTKIATRKVVFSGKYLYAFPPV